MATVTYKNQPGIHATRGTVPLAGTRHLYTVSKVLWPESISEFLESLFIGRSLHVCCGKSPLGDVRLDFDPDNKPDILCDAADMKLAVPSRSFDSVLCDPPYNGQFQWNHDLLAELARVASKRIIFQHWFIPANPDGRYKKAQDDWALSATYVWQPRTYFGRAQIISVFDLLTHERTHLRHHAHQNHHSPWRAQRHSQGHGHAHLVEGSGQLLGHAALGPQMSGLRLRD